MGRKKEEERKKERKEKKRKEKKRKEKKRKEKKRKEKKLILSFPFLPLPPQKITIGFTKQNLMLHSTPVTKGFFSPDSYQRETIFRDSLGHVFYRFTLRFIKVNRRKAALPVTVDISPVTLPEPLIVEPKRERKMVEEKKEEEEGENQKEDKVPLLTPEGGGEEEAVGGAPQATTTDDFRSLHSAAAPPEAENIPSAVLGDLD